jgi:Zn-dependent M28 family amino/carboxypeptidase
LFGTDLRKGALGSRYFVSHPTVELSSIAAVLNGDMIGRNAPDSAGTIRRNRTSSSDLVAITLAANKSIANFKVDTSWDAADLQRMVRPKRSSSYAQANVPAIFLPLYYTLTTIPFR